MSFFRTVQKSIDKDMKYINSLCGTRHSHAGTFDHTKNDSIPVMAL